MQQSQGCHNSGMSDPCRYQCDLETDQTWWFGHIDRSSSKRHINMATTHAIRADAHRFIRYRAFAHGKSSMQQSALSRYPPSRLGVIESEASVISSCRSSCVALMEVYCILSSYCKVLTMSFLAKFLLHSAANPSA